MTPSLSIAAAFRFGVGNYFTKGATRRVSIFKAIGLLSNLNGFFAILVIFFSSKWIFFRVSVPYLHILGALGYALTAPILFSLVSRSKACAASIGSALSPAIVLILAPLTLGTTTSITQTLVALTLICATLIPICKSFLGLNPAISVLRLLVAGGDKWRHDNYESLTFQARCWSY